MYLGQFFFLSWRPLLHSAQKSALVFKLSECLKALGLKGSLWFAFNDLGSFPFFNDFTFFVWCLCALDVYILAQQRFLLFVCSFPNLQSHPSSVLECWCHKRAPSVSLWSTACGILGGVASRSSRLIRFAVWVRLSVWCWVRPKPFLTRQMHHIGQSSSGNLPHCGTSHESQHWPHESSSSQIPALTSFVDSTPSKFTASPVFWESLVETDMVHFTKKNCKNCTSLRWKWLERKSG